VIAALTGIGLSAAAGLNAFIPFLLVALAARFTDAVDLPHSLAWIESNWSIGIASVLLLSEIVLDKIPIVDHVNDTVATLIRPTVGGLMVAATSAAEQADSSAWMQEHPWVGIGLGVVVAGLVHAGKATARPAIHLGTLGVGGPVVSAVEDTMSFALSVVAIFVPLLVVAVLALIVWAFWRLLRRLRRSRTPPTLGAAPT
jgi:hypothetical protein